MMAEEQKPPVEGQDTGKTAEEVVAEAKAEAERYKKEAELAEERRKNAELLMSRQATELGELRKKSEPKPEPKDKDELVEEIYQDLRADGLDEETARYNAKILAKSGVRVIDKRLNERMMSEVVDLVEEAFEEKKIDEKIFKENEEAIMSEFKARKLAPTARKNYKILRDCYDTVVRRKADALRSENEKVESEKRDNLIAEGSQPPSGSRNLPDSDEAAKHTESIRNAGVKRNSAFF